MDRLLRGEIPPGGTCDVKTFAREAGVDRTAFHGTCPYAYLRAEFEQRLQALQQAGDIPDPREAQITRLEADRPIGADDRRAHGLPHPGPCLTHRPARGDQSTPRSRRGYHSGQPAAATPNHRHRDMQSMPHTRPKAGAR
ncbi:hypothetical protein GCM10010193_62570 [Kitasatospora atroaurantiaca]